MVQRPLARLEHEAVANIVGDMLAMRGSIEPFVEFIAARAEGNPFFVGEYLRTAVSERALYRDGGHAWRATGQDPKTPARFEALPLPGTLRDLIEHRLRRLSFAAQQVGLAAAVLGRETDSALLREIAAISEESMLAATDELLRRQILERAVGDRTRFAHDQLRAVLYSRAPAEELASLHSRAADAFESTLQGRTDAAEHWATLSHHFAGAGRREPAAKYLKLAAEHARTSHANEDAMRFYGGAIEQLEELQLSLSSDSHRWEEALGELYEALADMRSLGRECDCARAAYRQALARIAEHDPVARARLHRKIGRSWDMQHHPDDALRFYDLALSILEPHCPPSVTPEDAGPCIHEKIQTHIDRMWVHYYTGRVEEMRATIEHLTPLVEAHASPAERALFFQNRTLFQFRRDVYFISEETLAFTKRALDGCRTAKLPHLPLAQFVHGFAHLFQHSLRRAESELRSALTLAQKAGDATVQARSLVYLTVAARMRGSIEEVEPLIEHSARVAADANAPEYAAATLGNRAWALLRRDDLAGSDALGRQALARWHSVAALFPFHWLALLPLLEVSLRRDDMARCVEYTEALLAPGQHFLLGSASDAFADALASWRAGEPSRTRRRLERALGYLEGTGYR